MIKLGGLAPKNATPMGDEGEWQECDTLGPGRHAPALLWVPEPPASSAQNQHRGSEVSQAVPGCSGDVQVPSVADAQAVHWLTQPDAKRVSL